jgi:2'-5' RNA ligase
MELPSLYGYVVWLLLSAESSRTVENWIGILAEETGSPVFKPHLTLARIPVQVGFNEMQRITDNLAKSFNPVNLNVTGTEYGTSPYQSFFLKINMDYPLRSLHSSLLESINNNNSDHDFNPHISLHYGYLTESGKDNLKHIIQIPEDINMRGDCLALVKLNGKPDKWSIVHKSLLKPGQR